MDLNDYKRLPEGLDYQDLVPYVLRFLAESRSECLDDSIQKLKEIGDRQWHTSRIPEQAVKDAVEQWIFTNWIENDEFLLAVLIACYCFALQKETMKKALAQYSGSATEFEESLENSPGEFVDPYWTYKRTGASTFPTDN